MALRFKVQLVMIAEDGEETAHELVVLDKEHERIEQLGLSLAEAKLLLRELQQQTHGAPRQRQLLALLALHPAGVAHERLAQLIWPEVPCEQALHFVQMTTYGLRQQLGGKHAVRYEAGRLRLNPEFDLLVDVDLFEALLIRSRGARRDEVLRTARRLYRGPLLADVTWSWVQPFRSRYASRYELSGALLRRADPGPAGGRGRATTQDLEA
jgi:DNA-binding SARP family transcriptional activator